MLSFGFETWLLETIRAYDLEAVFARKLTDRLHLFDPSLVPFEFRPRLKRTAEELEILEKWESAKERINEEERLVRHQDRIENPDYWNRVDNLPISLPAKTEVERAALRETLGRLNAHRVEARKRLRQRQEQEPKTKKSKPLSGKRSRSATRPAA